MIFGFDYLGGAMFPKILIENHPKGFAAGFFAETFGNCFPVADKLLATGKCPRIRIQGPWTSHTYSPGKHDKAIFVALEKCNQLKAKYPHIHVQFSPVCEHNIKGQTLVNLLNKCGDASRDVEIVNNPYQGDFSKRFMNETHHNKPVPKSFGAYQFSYDGISTVDSDVEKDKETHKDAQVFFMWVPSFNLKYKVTLSGDETAQVKKNDTSPPKERHCKPNADMIKSLAVLAQPKGKTSLKKGNTWKSHADRGGTPMDPRAWKPVLISPVKADFAKLMDGNKVISKSSAPTNFHGGGFAYRFPKYGYQISSKVLRVVVGSTEIGSVSPAYRDGSFR